jgi:hypothetical protein
MGKVPSISTYSKLSNDELLLEANRLRYEIDNPRLKKRDYVKNFLLSVVGIGTTFATGGWIAHRLFRKEAPEKPMDIESVKDAISIIRNKKRNPDAYKNYRDNQTIFHENLMVTVSTFAISSLVALPIIYFGQRTEHAQDAATELGQVERLLKERGVDLAPHPQKDEEAKPNAGKSSYQEQIRQERTAPDAQAKAQTQR